MRRSDFLALGLALLPGSALAAESCTLPSRIPAARALSVPRQEVNKVPVQGYLLAMSWSPEFCDGQGRNPRQKLQCGGEAGSFGFVLHGLWPDGKGRDDPAWCRPALAIPAATVRQHLCMSPSVDLLQHEWAKHGTCMSATPERYFKAASILFRSIKQPDMAQLAEEQLTVGSLRGHFAARNPGVPPEAISVQTGRDGWLKEVRICLGRTMRPRACPPEDRGARPNLEVRIRPQE